jgi:hypothetical protein
MLKRREGMEKSIISERELDVCNATLFAFQNGKYFILHFHHRTVGRYICSRRFAQAHRRLQLQNSSSFIL